ncbi:MAG: YihY/virulence factor BrkB family protein [Saccharospirillum sp.]
MTTANRSQARLDTLKAWLQQREQTDLPLPGRWLFHLGRVVYGVGRSLLRGNTNLYAMSLVYTTLLSTVPLLALSFSVLKGFGVHNQLEPILQGWLLAPLGAQSQEITENVLNFVDNIRVGVLGAVGLGVLVYTVISLVQKIERAFNEAWRVHQPRPLAQRFSNYLSVIMIGPLLAFSAIGATAAVVGSEFAEQLRQVQPFGWLFGLASRLMPFLLIITLFTFLNMLIPNTRVQFRHALLGGCTSGIAWQLVGYLFALFVATSTRYTAIYSGFAVGILLLLWLYMAWFILLLGAQFTFHSQNARRVPLLGNRESGPSDDERLGLMLIHEIGRRFYQGEPGLRLYDWATAQVTDPDDLERALKRLTKEGWIQHADGDRWVPAKPLSRMPMVDILRTIRRSGVPGSDTPLPVSRAQQKMEEQLLSHWQGLSLEDWVAAETTLACEAEMT